MESANLSKKETKTPINSSVGNSSTNIEDYLPNIGKQCRKKCKTMKPFKSGFKVNTIKGVIMHPILNIPGYTFVEDESFVECRRCRVIKTNPGIERVGIVNLDVMEQLNLFQPNTKNYYIELMGVSVKANSQRYAVFKRNLTCVTCGITGKYFAIEKTEKKANHYHLNLYGVDENGNEVLMTKDHIWAKANGGKSNLANYQTMCHPCNHAKGRN